jgi:hypothetical protein
MAVHPDYRKGGIATEMINLMLSVMPEKMDSASQPSGRAMKRECTSGIV